MCELLEGKRDYAISYIRMISMLTIVICHFLQYYDNVFAFEMNIGVQLFLLISGFLYSNKSIEQPLCFLKKQFFKILLPYYLFLFPCTVLYFIFARNYISLSTILVSWFCVGTIPGLEHLWFVGTILFCYILTPYLNMYTRGGWKKKSNAKKILVLLFAFFLIEAVGRLSKSIVSPSNVISYVIGYVIGVEVSGCDTASGRVTINKRTMRLLLLWSGIIALISNGIRIYIEYFSSAAFERVSHLAFWDCFADYSKVILGVCLFLGGYLIFSLSKRTNVVLKFSDGYSYEVYLVHQLFILSPFSLMNITESLLLNWGLVVLSIIILSIFLKKEEAIFARIFFKRYNAT